MGTIAHTPWRGAGPSQAVRSAGRNDTTASSVRIAEEDVRPRAIRDRSVSRMARAAPKTVPVEPLVQAEKSMPRTARCPRRRAHGTLVSCRDYRGELERACGVDPRDGPCDPFRHDQGVDQDGYAYRLGA